MSKTILFFSAASISLIKMRLDLMKDFQRANYKVIACIPSDSHVWQVKECLRKLNVETVNVNLDRASYNIFNDIFSFISLYKIFKKIRPDIVYLSNIKPVIYGSLAAKFCGIKKIYSTITGLGSIFVSGNKFVRELTKLLYKFALRYNQKVFFQNSDDLSFFVHKKITEKEKVVLVDGEGVNLQHYSFSTIPKQISFVMVARFIKDKGIYEYIYACNKLKNKYPQISFYLFGSLDSNPTSLTQEEFNYFIDNKIINYIDDNTDVRQALKNASIFVLPSYREGRSQATLEAMAMGRPIITTDTAGCRETIYDGVNGYLVPIKDSNSLAKAMERFILFPRNILKMGKASRRIAEEKYDVRKVNKKILCAMDIAYNEQQQAILEQAII
ncbi:MAG: glycosyltransferase family 4 protein [Rickettsiales bacterium]|nr:glycosyltransferase family 4 protein [Rickettsiales bacterium]